MMDDEKEADELEIEADDENDDDGGKVRDEDGNEEL
jgi:hypothetical protein